MATRVKALANNTKGISPNHRQHGHVKEKNHKHRALIRRLLKEKLEEIEAYENRYDT